MEDKQHDASSEPAHGGARIGLGDLAQPRVEPLDKKLAESVHDFLSHVFPDTRNVRFCSVELSVSHGQLVVGQPAPAFVEMANGAQAELARKFLADEGFKALRDRLPALVADLLRLTRQDRYIIANEKALINDQWRLVVDLDVFRRYTDKQRFHKDTLGRTLFTFLAYLFPGVDGEKFVGPEYIVNPPTIRGHLAYIERTMPAGFIADVRDQVDRLPEPDTIEYATLERASVIGMVDELVHHSTPLDGSREVRYSLLQLTEDNVLGPALRTFHGEEVFKQFEEISRRWLGDAEKPPKYATHAQFDAVKSRYATVIQNLAGMNEHFTPDELQAAVASTALYEAIMAKAHPEVHNPAAEHFNQVTLKHSDTNSLGNALTFSEPLRTNFKRQLSEDRRNNKPLPKFPDTRPFLRGWVMSIPRAGWPDSNKRDGRVVHQLN